MNHESWGAWYQGSSGKVKYLNRISKSGEEGIPHVELKTGGEIRAILEFES